MNSLKERVVGTWDLVSNYAVRQDGSRLDPFGPNSAGRYMLDATGRFTYMIYGSGRPKFASNNRREGSSEENKAAVQGIIAFYGTYTVDEPARTVTWHVERCSFPNWEGSDRKTTVMLTAMICRIPQILFRLQRGHTFLRSRGKGPSRDLKCSGDALRKRAMSAFGPKRTWASALEESAFEGKADIA